MRFILFILAILLFNFGFSDPNSSWSKVLENQKGNVKVNYYNSENFISDESGRLKGIEYDLFESFFKYCESKYNVKIDREYVKSSSFKNLYNHIKDEASSGEFAACSFSMTPTRMQEVTFSPKYMPDIEVLICSHNIPLVSDTTEFIDIFKNTTALTVPNTTFDEDIQVIKKLIPSLNVKNINSAIEIRDRVSKEDNLFSYIELPNYILALKKGINLKRQLLFKAERWGYGFIMPQNNDWEDVVNEYFSSNIYREEIQQIITKHLGNDVKELITDQAEMGIVANNKELLLLNKEREIQDLEIEKQKIQLKAEQSWRYVLLFAALFVVIVAFLLYKQNRIKEKSNTLLQQQNSEINLQKMIIEEKSDRITDSIEYAKRIQSAALPSDKEVKNFFPHSFIFYKPKDGLSGDFYWVGKTTSSTLDEILIASVGDCTGHGVPGALLSILGINYFNIASRSPEINNPAEALDFVNTGIMDTFSEQERTFTDGMDAVMVAINKSTLLMNYACAINPVYIVRERELTVLKGDRFPIGKKSYAEFNNFTNFQFQLQKGDKIFLFSDGYIDQFGGADDKKYGSKSFKRLITSNIDSSMSELKSIIEKEFSDWKGANEQTDDICVFGLSI